MRNLLEFVKTTVIGGFFGLVPVVGVIFIVAESLNAVGVVITPIAENLPVETIGGIELAHVLALVLVLGFCFGVGALLQTQIGARGTRWLDERVLDRIPGYNVLRGLSASFAGDDDTTRFAPAAVDLHGSGVFAFAFIVEELADGAFTVLVPISPTPSLGTLHYAPAERVRRLEVPLGTAVNCIMRWGIGSSALVDSAGPPLHSPPK